MELLIKLVTIFATLIFTIIAVIKIFAAFLNQLGYKNDLLIFSSKIFSKLKSIKVYVNNFDTTKSNHLTCNDKLSSKTISYIIAATLAGKLFTFALGYIFYFIFNNPSGKGIWTIFSDIWFKWDSPHYAFIAEHGYVTTGDERYFIVFYPFYSLCIRLFNYVFNNSVLSGVLVSMISLVIANIFLYKLVLIDYKDKNIARISLEYIAIYPFAFFFGIVYTESLFFALTVLTIYYSRKNKWLKACIFGMLSAFTKNQGILISIAVFMEMLLSIDIKSYLKEKDFKVLFKRFILIFSNIFLIPLGFIGYLVINKIVYNNWFQFLIYQKENWQNEVGNYIINIGNQVKYIFQSDPSYVISTHLPQFAVFFIILMLIIVCSGKARASYGAYSLAYLVVSYSPTWLLSGARYSICLFPLYIYIAVLTYNRKNLRYALQAIMLLGLVFYTFLWCQSYIV